MSICRDRQVLLTVTSRDYTFLCTVVDSFFFHLCVHACVTACIIVFERSVFERIDFHAFHLHDYIVCRLCVYSA